MFGMKMKQVGVLILLAALLNLVVGCSNTVSDGTASSTSTNETHDNERYSTSTSGEASALLMTVSGFQVQLERASLNLPRIVDTSRR